MYAFFSFCVTDLLKEWNAFVCGLVGWSHWVDEIITAKMLIGCAVKFELHWSCFLPSSAVALAVLRNWLLAKGYHLLWS